jgi:hypothetical protein
VPPKSPSYETLPIYRAATTLAVSMDRFVRGFSRFHKYTVGTRLRESSTNVVLLVGRAYRRGLDRSATLTTRCDAIEELKLLVNLGKEVLGLSPRWRELMAIVTRCSLGLLGKEIA